MRKKWFCILLSVLCFLSLPFFSVCAADGRTPDKVVDRAGLLTDAEEADLRTRMAEVIGRYACDIVILTVETTNGLSAQAYADDYFDSNGYGIGHTRDGVLLLLSMEERDWHIGTSGSAESIFTEYGLDYLEERLVPLLRSGDYKGAFDKFVSLCEEFIREAAAGAPYDTNHKIKEAKTISDYALYAGISILIGAVVAFIVTSSMKSKLKTNLPQHSAHAYIRDGGVRLTNEKDLYLYSTVSRTAKPKDTGSGGGGGGSRTHTSSSGRSHGGRSGKF